jgi:hypothetical protein
VTAASRFDNRYGRQFFVAGSHQGESLRAADARPKRGASNVGPPEVQAFVNKLLLNQTGANTSIARDAYNTGPTKWVTWTTPTLQ